MELNQAQRIFIANILLDGLREYIDGELQIWNQEDLSNVTMALECDVLDPDFYDEAYASQKNQIDDKIKSLLALYDCIENDLPEIKGIMLHKTLEDQLANQVGDQLEELAYMLDQLTYLINSYGKRQQEATLATARLNEVAQLQQQLQDLAAPSLACDQEEEE